MSERFTSDFQLAVKVLCEECDPECMGELPDQGWPHCFFNHAKMHELYEALENVAGDLLEKDAEALCVAVDARTDYMSKQRG